MEEPNKTEKPQEGTWDNLKGYPQKIKFDLDRPIVITFPSNFSNPQEMPQTNGEGVFYVFDCMSEGVKSCIMTSSWTMLNNLKTHEPLAGKTLIITKKNVGGKNMFYIETPVQNENRVAAEPKDTDTEEAGINNDGTI